jgi:hypothetical protein
MLLLLLLLHVLRWGLPGSISCLQGGQRHEAQETAWKVVKAWAGNELESDLSWHTRP